MIAWELDGKFLTIKDGIFKCLHKVPKGTIMVSRKNLKLAQFGERYKVKFDKELRDNSHFTACELEKFVKSSVKEWK